MNRITDEQVKRCINTVTIDSLAQALDAEVSYITKIDSRGKVTKKIVFEYGGDE